MNLSQFLPFRACQDRPRTQWKVTFPLDPKQLIDVNSDQVEAFTAYQADNRFLDSLQKTLAAEDGQSNDLDTLKNGSVAFKEGVFESDRGTLEGGSVNLEDGSTQVKYKGTTYSPLSRREHWLTREADGSIEHKTKLINNPHGRSQPVALLDSKATDTYRVNPEEGTVTLHHQEWYYGR